MRYLPFFILLIATNCLAWGSNAPSMFVNNNSAPSGNTLTFSDSFDSGTLEDNGWSPFIGTVTKSTDYIIGVTANATNSLVRAVNPNVLNGTVTVTCSRTGMSTQAQPGTVFRVIDNENYSAVYFKPWTNELSYTRYASGIAVDYAVGTLPLPSDTTKTIVVTFSGSTITVTNEGSTILTGIDTNPLAGNLGPLVKNGSVANNATVRDWSGESL